MKRLAEIALLLAIAVWAGRLEAQPPSNRGERGRPGSSGDRGGFSRGGGGGFQRPGGGFPGGPGGFPGGGMRGSGGPPRGDRMGVGGFPGGPGGRPGGTRGGDRSGGRGTGPPLGGQESAEDRFARFEGMLRGFDTNRDGTIDPREVPEDRRRFLTFIGERMGVDFSKPVAIDKLREKAAEQFGGDRKKKEPEPLVPGFGVPQEPTSVLAFGVRPPEPKSSTSARGSAARPGGDNRQGADQDARAQGFADMMIRRYDRNGSGALEKDEWGELRGDPNQMDRNRDGKIDRQELAAHVASSMNRSSEGQGGRASRGGGDARQARSDDEKDSARRSYRFLSPAERLPEGLPDWFAERDANQDGQVTMAEFTDSWTEGKAREFTRYDLSGDGRITPEECLQAMQMPETQSTVPEGPPPADGQGSPAPAGETKPGEKTDSGGAKPWWMS